MAINYARDQMVINIWRYSLGSLQLITEIVSAFTGRSANFGVNSISTVVPSAFTSIGSFGLPTISTCKCICNHIMFKSSMSKN